MKVCKTSRFPYLLDTRFVDGGEIFSLTPFAPGGFLLLISVTGRVDPRTIVHLERLNQMEHSVTSLGIETATLLVA
jgi:hypothetical protein